MDTPIEAMKARPRLPPTRANASQLAILEAAFAQSDSTTAAELETLSASTGLSSKWITSWFTRQRSKLKKARAAATVLPSNANASEIMNIKQELSDPAGAPTSVSAIVRVAKRKEDQQPGAVTKKTRKKKEKAPFVAFPIQASSSDIKGVLADIQVKVEKEPGYELRYTPGPEERLFSNSGISAVDTISNGSHNVQRSAYSHPSSTSLDSCVALRNIASVHSGVTQANGTSGLNHCDNPDTCAANMYSPRKLPRNGSRLYSASIPPKRRKSGAAKIATSVSSGVIVSNPTILPSGEGVSGSTFYPPESCRTVTDDFHIYAPIPVQAARNALLVEESLWTYDAAFRPSTPVSYDESSGKESLMATTAPQHVAAASEQLSAESCSTRSSKPSVAHSESTARPVLYSTNNLQAQVPPTNLMPIFPTYLDSSRAPLKYVSDVVEPFLSNDGGFSGLMEMEGEQRRVVMERLLDEEMGVNDPFKGAMGLVLASKLGLHWDYD